MSQAGVMDGISLLRPQLAVHRYPSKAQSVVLIELVGEMKAV